MMYIYWLYSGSPAMPLAAASLDVHTSSQESTRFAHILRACFDTTVNFQLCLMHHSPVPDRDISWETFCAPRGTVTSHIKPITIARLKLQPSATTSQLYYTWYHTLRRPMRQLELLSSTFVGQMICYYISKWDSIAYLYVYLWLFWYIVSCLQPIGGEHVSSHRMWLGAVYRL
jgi:hypothetical protein